MTKNVTLRLDEDILKKCRYAAVEEDMSLSRWISTKITEIIKHREEFGEARARAIRRLKNGYPLGGKPLTREEIYER